MVMRAVAIGSLSSPQGGGQILFAIVKGLCVY